MRLVWGIMLFSSINSYSQIIDLEHPTSLFIPYFKQKCYDELLKDIKCKDKAGLTITCLKLNDRDTFLVFYLDEPLYQNTYLFSYWKKGDSAVGVVYYDKGFTKPFGNPAMGSEWKPGLVLKYYSSISDPICFGDLLEVLKDTVLRTMDTTSFISHSPDLYFSFYFGNKNVNRAVHGWRSLRSPVIMKLEDQLWSLEKKLPK